MLRRLASSKLKGTRLIELPPKTVEVCKLEFTLPERQIYDEVCMLNHLRRYTKLTVTRSSRQTRKRSSELTLSFARFGGSQTIRPVLPKADRFM